MFSTQQEKALRAFSEWCLCYHRKLSKHALAFLLAASAFSAACRWAFSLRTHLRLPWLGVGAR